MAYLANPNVDSLCSIGFSFLMNPNRYRKDRYIRIVSNMIELLAKGIFSANQVCVAGLLYDKKTRKIGGGGGVWLPRTSDKDVCS